MQLSTTVEYLGNKFKNLFSKESVEELVSNNKVSYESAMGLVTSIESDGNAVCMTEDEIQQSAVEKLYGDVKFGAMVNAIKKDDTFLYNEYKEVTAARDKIASEIVAKYEGDFNLLLDEIKTVSGVDGDTIDKLRGVKTDIGDIADNL